jgi:hypothetical protein
MNKGDLCKGKRKKESGKLVVFVRAVTIADKRVEKTRDLGVRIWVEGSSVERGWE